MHSQSTAKLPALVVLLPVKDLEENMFKDMDVQFETGMEDYEDNLSNSDFEEDYDYEDFNLSSDWN